MEAVPAAVGKTAASPGRSTPGSTPSTSLAVTMAAPVLPAETKPAATPSLTRRKPDAHRRIAFLLDRVRRFLLHADDFAGMHNLDGELRGSRMLRQLGANHLFLADQQHPHAVMPGSQDRALDLRLGRPV